MPAGFRAWQAEVGLRELWVPLASGLGEGFPALGQVLSSIPCGLPSLVSSC